MLFNKDSKDGLTLMSGENRGRGVRLIFTLLAALAIAAAAFLGGRAWLRQRAEKKAEAMTPVPRAASDEGMRLLAQARTLKASGALEQAREKAFEALALAGSPAGKAAAEEMLGALHMELLSNPLPMKEKEDYVVLAGDSIEKIAKKFGTTSDLIRKSNRLSSDTIHPGDRLRVFKVVFTIVVNKTKNDLLLQANDRFFKRYRVGTGKFATTPTGVFAIDKKIPEPPWTRPSDRKILPFGDKENVLGTRWLSLKAVEGTPSVQGYGIHGTWEPETIGSQSSAGCVRMLNAEVEELFSLVPEGVRVVINE
ncbi:MAG: L,D-transpeptidase family protein [Lentisphaerae bacterium]|nr:L,D-transpeptidase family protein [Lentisphaerota bacterium]